MNEQTLPQTEKKVIPLEEVYSLCQDDQWLMNFIQDTENCRMVKAPSHMKEEMLERISYSPSLSSAGRSLSPPAAGKPLSKRMELFLYSLRVSAAAMGAIIILFLTPPSLELLHTTFSHSIIEFSTVFYQREVPPND